MPSTFGLIHQKGVFYSLKQYAIWPYTSSDVFYEIP